MDDRASDVQAQQRLLSARSSLNSEIPSITASATTTKGHAAACRALQASHFLSTWGQRGWEFTVGLVMLELYPSSLLLVAVWGLLDAALSVLCGAAVGRHVDRLPRLSAASLMYLLQNSMLALSAAAALVLLLGGMREGAPYWCGLAVTMGAGAISTLGALGSTLSVEREWTKALCGSDSVALSSLNAAMKRIDLTCLIASPILTGLVMQHAGRQPMAAAVLVLLGWNLASWLPEVMLLRYAQRRSPLLAAEKLLVPQTTAFRGSGTATATTTIIGSSVGTSRGASPHTSLEHSGSPAPIAQPAAAAGASDSASSRGGSRLDVLTPLRHQMAAWRLYALQPAAPAALSLALLYLTVLSWGTLMTAYIKSLGLPEADLAMYRGLGAVSGILATLTFPPLQRRLGLVATGCLSIWLQLVFLVAAVLPSLLKTMGAHVSARARMYALVWGLVLSRFGLWQVDLAANQLIQETVQHSALGAVSGVQGSMQSLFQMLAYLAGVLMPATNDFVYLMAASCGVVALAAAIFTAFAVVSRCGRRVVRS